MNEAMTKDDNLLMHLRHQLMVAARQRRWMRWADLVMLALNAAACLLSAIGLYCEVTVFGAGAATVFGAGAVVATGVAVALIWQMSHSRDRALHLTELELKRQIECVTTRTP